MTDSLVETGMFIEIIPEIGRFVPTVLMNSSSLLVGAETADSYMESLIVTLLLCIACFVIGVPIMDKRQI